MTSEIVERTIRGDHLNRRTEPGDDCGGRHKTSDASQEVPIDRRQIVVISEIPTTTYQKAVPYVYI